MSNHRVCLPVVAGVLAFAAAGPAGAQSVCGERAEIIKVLDNKYHEMPKAFGIAGQRNLVELFTSKTGSWTMLMTQPKGVTCILATGQSWEELPPGQKLTGL
ncbi:MAG: hypothetical protein ACT4SY_14615 [Hyphomicrobiales bacterium]